MEKEKLWTKDFIIISASNFFLMLVMYLLIVTIGPYATEQFDAPTSMAGLVSGIFIIGTLLGRIMTGRIIEGIGSKKILMVGLVFFLITTSFYFFANSLPTLLITRLLHGFGLGISTTATGTIIAQIIPPTKRGEGIGYFSLSTVLATAIGPFLGILLSHSAGYRVIFVFCLVLAAISFVTSILVKMEHEAAAVPKVAQEKKKGGLLSSFIEPKALPIAIITLIVAFCYSGVLSFVAFYAEEIKLVDAASFFFLVYAIAVLFSRPFTGKLMDAKGANVVVVPALIIFAAGMFILSSASHGATLLLAGAVIGLGFGNFQSCAQAIAIKGIDPHRLGLATSTFFIFLDSGFGFGPYLYGQILPHTGYSHLYFAMSFVILGALVLYYFLHGKKERTIRKSVLQENVGQ